ncbi:sensor histidine kinase [Kitasatospora phosalacinea]|uniref:histidine kinase n=1 Tax=Kitasatospora phosalacinea TaxID=2065 RepID=A0A9W6UKD8_9ACTN|nr:HAMP domain-containing sensor histidine kinase [Kitasatospora phosalacinea]GLW53321.1 two-component sensor histidine kinase [Kitasatospora phosalacinea]
MADRARRQTLHQALRRALRRLVPRSVRARATFAATAVVALALGGTALALLGVLQANLTRDVRESAVRQVDEVAAVAVRQHLPPVISNPGGGSLRVFDAEGNLISATLDALPRPLPPVPLPPSVPDLDEDSVTPFERRLPRRGDEQEIVKLVDGSGRRVVSTSVSGPDGQVTIYASVSLGPVDAANRTATAALAVGLPLLVALVALVTWRVTGRALRPVEAIRSEVAEITGHDLHRRVPVPDTGDEVSRLAVTVNSTLDRLEDAGQRQRRFIADASHELRSPIAVLRTQLEVALAHPDPELWPELLADALQDTVRLQDLAADLLLLARLDAADPVATELLDLDVLFADVLDARPADRVPLRAELASEARVLGNRTWLTRLLTNLVDNAQRYADGLVEVRLAVEEGGVVLEVCDDGPGIPEPDRERVFERFTRLDDARSRELGGAGLGLAIARDLAEHHGGTLAAERPTRAEYPTGTEHPCGARLVARLPSAGPLPQGS